MRARKKKHGAERLEAASAVRCKESSEILENIQSPFDGERPIHLEIGCGKGKFACDMAAAHPDVNFYAVEKVLDVMVSATERALACAESRPDNLRFILGDADTLCEWFAPHSIDCIYLNFSDPWPKKGYYKRRLTYRRFLEIYKTLLTRHQPPAAFRHPGGYHREAARFPHRSARLLLRSPGVRRDGQHL
ncbi:MAG: methyltransferase domain-containing protein, partial [Clostridia bacterium]|nr:methyltransferase domain-containing protein [Clostridia bacterium]